MRTVIIEGVEPELDAGRYPVKRVVGDVLTVSADMFREGHDVLDAVLLYGKSTPPGGSPDEWREAPMRSLGNDRWEGSFPLTDLGRWRYTLLAWPDRFRSWRSDLEKKHIAGEEISSDLLEGSRYVRERAEAIGGDDGRAIADLVRRMESTVDARAVALALSPALETLLARHPDRELATRYERELEVVVDRPEAAYAAWYEVFPRSQGRLPGQSATFKDVEARLPDIRDMGFNVLYFPPIHPIGRTNRKGKNNALVAAPGEPGSPYAIGDETGGHTAVHPELGTIEDFDHLVAAAHDCGIEIALDFAIQVSPDHPWVREHPEWFYHRPDGTIKYAENPPKKYQDIYPLNFYGQHKQELFNALRDVILFWVGHGVRTFRVDNPHTKPLDFWEWLIGEVHRDHPDVIFLSEAFTRPKVMRALAKAGFTQSYTYFTWRNHKAEIAEYFTELTQGPMREYFRGNLFANTPDILPEILQAGGRPAFRMRFVLAATLSSVYGIYNGYELAENRPRPGTEYYLDSEMYEFKVWDWDRPGHIRDLVTWVNAIRRTNPALQLYDNLRFYDSDDDHILWYGKALPDGSNVIFVAVNLDPFAAHAAHVRVPLADLGIGPGEPYAMHDLLTGARYPWRGDTGWVMLDPQVEPAHIFRLERAR